MRRPWGSGCRVERVQAVAGDEGPVVGFLQNVSLLSENGRLLGTAIAVVAGLTYNFLPFMTLPLYVALEKIDKRLIEAAEDLYAGPWRPQGTVIGVLMGGVLGLVVGLVMDYGPLALSIPFALAGGAIGTWLISQAFIRVTLPLALPGIFAGSLLTFIPAVGDFVNAELLGNPQSQMIGNVIQARFLEITDYPMASALSFILMAAIIIGVLIYARILGTEELTGGRA